MKTEAIKLEADSMHPLVPWLAAAGGGVLAFLGYVGFDQFYLEWICLVPVLWAISRQTPGKAFLTGWLAGIVGHAGGFYWIVTLLRQFAAAPLPIAVLGLLLLAAANGLVFAFWAWATRLINRDLGWSVALVSPVAWTAAEKFWPQVFPNYLGASQYRLTLLTQIADITGILGVTFLVICINSVVYTVIERIRDGHRRPWRPAVALAAVLSVVLVYGAVRIRTVDERAASSETMAVGIVQTNRGAGDKYADAALLLKEHREMSRELEKADRLDLIVWPESIVGMDLPSRRGVLPGALFGDLRTPLLFGAVIRTAETGEQRMHNSAILADGAGRITGTYDKMVLVPFGEYIPFGDVFPRLYSWSPYSGRFWRGSITEPLTLNGHFLSVNICYEDIFPGQVRMLMQGGQGRRTPEALFNLTNDSWYGDTIQPLEHLVLASFRSIEHRRALVRATNTGISAIVDPAGRIDRRTLQWTKASLVGKVPLIQGRTVYGVLGDWIGWGCAGITLYGLGGSFLVARKSARSGKQTSKGRNKKGKAQSRKI